MPVYVDIIEQLKVHKGLSTRVRFMCRDLLDLKSNGWKLRDVDAALDKQTKTVTKAEFRNLNAAEEAKREQDKARLAKEAARGGGGGGRHEAPGPRPCPVLGAAQDGRLLVGPTPPRVQPAARRARHAARHGRVGPLHGRRRRRARRPGARLVGPKQAGRAAPRPRRPRPRPRTSGRWPPRARAQAAVAGGRRARRARGRPRCGRRGGRAGRRGRLCGRRRRRQPRGRGAASDAPPLHAADVLAKRVGTLFNEAVANGPACYAELADGLRALRADQGCEQYVTERRIFTVTYCS
jgi:hypothetical protein